MRKLSFWIVVFFFVLSFKGFSCTLYWFTGAGIKKPAKRIAKMFEKTHHCKVAIITGGSGQVLNEMLQTKKAVYTLVDALFLKKAIHRNPKIFKENAPSRGHIVKKFLTENINEKEFISFLKDTKSIFNGYNLVFGRLTDKWLFYYSNIKDKLVEIEDGIHYLSNAFLNSS